MLKNLKQIHLKPLQKESFKKQQKQLVNLLEITKVSKNSQQNNSVTNEHDKEIPKERCVSLEERQEIINELRLK